MTPKPVVVDWRASLEEAFRVLDRFPFRHLPVVEGDSLIGVVSDQDLLVSTQVLERESARNRRSLRNLIASCPVGNVIRAPRISVSPEDSLARVVRLMLDNGVDALPVVSEGRLVGIVTSTDVLDSFVEMCLEHGASCDGQVIQYMRRSLATLSPDTPAREALEGLDPDFEYALVQTGPEVVGVVSGREIRLALVQEMMTREDATNGSEGLRLRDVITSVSHGLEPGSRLSRAALKMVAEEVGALPVTRMGRPLGLLGQTEILRHYLGCL